MATLAAFEIRGACPADRADVSCYTFGAPRTGNRAFAREYNAAVPDTWSIINDQVCHRFLQVCLEHHSALAWVDVVYGTVYEPCGGELVLQSAQNWGSRLKPVSISCSSTSLLLRDSVSGLSHCHGVRTSDFLTSSSGLLSCQRTPLGPGRRGAPRQVYRALQAPRTASHHQRGRGRHRASGLNRGEEIHNTQMQACDADLWHCRLSGKAVFIKVCKTLSPWQLCCQRERLYYINVIDSASEGAKRVARDGKLCFTCAYLVRFMSDHDCLTCDDPAPTSEHVTQGRPSMWQTGVCRIRKSLSWSCMNAGL